MQELIDRLQKTTKPDRRLDIDIGCALDIETAWSGDLAMLGYDNDSYIALGAKPYTASIDAAVTLLPDGWRIVQFGDECEDDNDPNKVTSCYVRLKGPNRNDYASAECHTRAGAICSAAIKARGTLLAKEGRTGG